MRLWKHFTTRCQPCEAANQVCMGSCLDKEAVRTEVFRGQFMKELISSFSNTLPRRWILTLEIPVQRKFAMWLKLNQRNVKLGLTRHYVSGIEVVITQVGSQIDY